VPEGLALALALAILAGTLPAAVAQSPDLAEAVVATAGAVVVLAAGVVSISQAGNAVRDLGPTVGFLAALLLIADGLPARAPFDGLGAVMARGARGTPRRLLALVLAIPAGVTAVLSPTRPSYCSRPSSSPRRCGCARAQAIRLRVLAPGQLGVAAAAVSNLTNLLAFRASELPFVRFAALMALPTIAAVRIEWALLTRFSRSTSDPRVTPAPRRHDRTCLASRSRCSPSRWVALR
jgi:arsenical pump membrane protein